MLSRSERFDAAVRAGGTVVARIDVFRAGALIASSADGGFAVESAEVTLDVSAAVQGRLDMVLSDETGEIIPVDTEDPFSVVSSHTFRALRGFRYPDGTEELLGLGYFGIVDSRSVEKVGDFTVAISALDRSRRVRRNRFLRPYVVPAGTNYATAIADLIRDRDPGADVVADSVAFDTPRLVFDENQDPLDAAIEMARSIGFDLWVDADDSYQLRRVPDPSIEPIPADWANIAGSANTVTEVGRSSSNERAYNGYIVIGENSYGVAPVRGEAWDENPSSPTYRYGPYGQVPAPPEVSSLVRSVSQATEMARGKLNSSLGAVEQIEFSANPQPALRQRDVVRLDFPRSGVDGVYLLDRVVVPVGASGVMRATTRERRVLV